jgi:hypothetical protein
MPMEQHFDKTSEFSDISYSEALITVSRVSVVQPERCLGGLPLGEDPWPTHAPVGWAESLFPL